MSAEQSLPDVATAPLSTDAARALTEQIKSHITSACVKLTQAYYGQAWLALDYPTWDSYCNNEFGSLRLKLPRADRAEMVCSLRESGLSIRAIESATGASHTTIQKDLADSEVYQSGTPAESVVDGEVIESTTVDEPKAITGTDGKTYRRKTPKRKPPSSSPAPSKPKVAPRWAIVCDEDRPQTHWCGPDGGPDGTDPDVWVKPTSRLVHHWPTEQMALNAFEEFGNPAHSVRAVKLTAAEPKPSTKPEPKPEPEVADSDAAGPPLRLYAATLSLDDDPGLTIMWLDDGSAFQVGLDGPVDPQLTTELAADLAARLRAAHRRLPELGGQADAREISGDLVSTNRAANKQLRRLLVAIEDAGATVVLGRGSRHWKVYLDGALVAVIAGTCSSRQAHHHIRADLRRAGLDVKVPR